MNNSSGALGVKRSPSLESTSSVLITGPESRSQSAPASSIQEPEHDIYDCSACLVTCPKCHKIGVQSISGDKGLWLPKTPSTFTSGFLESMNLKLKLSLACASAPKGYIPFTPLEAIHYWRLQLPIVSKFMTRVTFRTSLKPEGGLCCKNTSDMIWLSEGDLSLMSKDVWGPEPAVFAPAQVTPTGYYPLPSTREETIAGWNEKRPQQLMQNVSTHAGYSNDVIQRLHLDFMQFCYPSQFMTRTSLGAYLLRLKWIKDFNNINNYFRAFSLNNLPYLDFNEFLMGIAFMDYATPHGAEAGRIRCEYIFRYYDMDDDLMLSESELKKLIQDTTPHDHNAFDHVIKKLGTIPWSESKFKDVVGSLKLRGTSKLFRGNSSFHKSPHAPFVTREVSSLMSSLSPKRPEGRLRCADCKSLKYTVAVHTVLMKMDGIPADPKVVTIEDNTRMPQDLRRRSEMLFSAQHPANLLLNGIRDFAEVKGIFKGISHTLILQKHHQALHGNPMHAPKAIEPFWTSPAQNVAQALLTVCDQLISIVKSEPRIIRVTHPALVVGTLGGHLRDLMVLEHHFWRAGPGLEAPTYIFMGNYSELANESLEVVSYLLSLKLQTPHRVILLKGLTDSRIGNKLSAGIHQKFGDSDLGKRVAASISGVLNSLPLSALIDHKILCVSSGVPLSIHSLAQLESSSDSSLSTAEKEILHGSAPEQESHYESFLSKHHLSHVMRGNEIISSGVKFYSKGRVITISSCSSINGNKCKAAVLMADDNKIIPIQF